MLCRVFGEAVIGVVLFVILLVALGFATQRGGSVAAVWQYTVSSSKGDIIKLLIIICVPAVYCMCLLVSCHVQQPTGHL